MRRAGGDLRSLAMLATIILAAALYFDLTGTPLLPRVQSVVAQVAPAVPLQRSAPFTPPRDAQMFWLSREFRPGDPRLVDVVGAGDVMMGSRDTGLNPDVDGDAAALVGRNLAGVFRHADIAFANLEGPLYDGDDGPSKICNRCYAFHSPTAYARVLASLGINTVSLANNHSGDYGETGRDSTIAALRANSISFCGLDRDDARVAEITLKGGIRAAIVSFAPNTGTPDINDTDAERVIVRSLKANHTIVMVSFHGGGEGESFLHVSDRQEIFDGEDRGNVVRFAHAAIDAGADIVIGQGPHVPRALEIYRGHLIAYSLGNFWTYGAIDTSAVRGAGPVLEAWLAPDGAIVGFAIHSTEQRSTGIPHLDPERDAEHTVLALTRDDFPATAARLDGTRQTIEPAKTAAPGS